MISLLSILVLLFLISLGVSARFRSLILRHPMRFAAAVFGAIVLMAFALVVGGYFSVDACLDGGGRWDKASEACQYQQ